MVDCTGRSEVFSDSRLHQRFPERFSSGRRFFPISVEERTWTLFAHPMVMGCFTVMLIRIAVSLTPLLCCSHSACVPGKGGIYEESPVNSFSPHSMDPAGCACRSGNCSHRDGRVVDARDSAMGQGDNRGPEDEKLFR
jgi:hypothetical protein